MKYYIIAGEASGDLHGSNLMREIKLLDREADFRFFGGDLMKEQGGTLVKHYADMAFMGFVEVIFNLRKILANLSFCKKDILAYQPDVLVLVDFPGFNMKIAEFAAKNNILVYYYISPKIWAWNTSRVHKIKKLVDRMFVILPFEVDFYKKWDYKVEYVGNPLLDAIAQHTQNINFRKENNISNRPVIALLPGSRKQEIERILPVMIEAAGKFPEHEIIIAGAPGFNADYYRKYIPLDSLKVVYAQTYDLLANAQAALVTSGTATLETALLNVPQVVCYKANGLSVAIARKLVKIQFISLVNLIIGREVVKELIQEECNAHRMANELGELINNKENRERMLKDYLELQHLMGEPGASKKAAGLMIKYLKNV